jgi:hypothetical protein
LDNPKVFFKERFIYFWGALFIAYHTWHFMFFGELLTNPMMAKGFWPYQPVFLTTGDVLRHYLIPFIEMAIHYCVVTILLAVYFIKFRNQPPTTETKDEDWGIIVWIAITGLVMMLITGNRWGAAQRLSYPALPFLLLLSFKVIDRISIKTHINKFTPTLIVLVLGLVTCIEYIFFSFQGMEFKVTVDEVLKGAHVATLTQKFLNMDVITFASPDMGGLMLFEGDNKRIIDLGLLCDKRLGKFGYSEVRKYIFQEEQPEIIKAHDVWIIPLKETDEFFEMYLPARIITEQGASYLFIREDLLSGFEKNAYQTSADVSPDIDQVLLKFGQYVVLDLRSSPR